jgi:hypothetical protein
MIKGKPDRRRNILYTRGRIKYALSARPFGGRKKIPEIFLMKNELGINQLSKEGLNGTSDICKRLTTPTPKNSLNF